jgi:hypothetical protein
MAKKSETGTKKVVVKKSAPARKVGPKGMTFCTLASRDGMTLGVRTGKGILDVAKAAALFRVKAPTTIHQVMEGADCAPLLKLVDKAVFILQVSV